MRKPRIEVPAIYDPIIYCAVLRDAIPSWDFESVQRAKNKHKKGKLRNAEIEQKLFAMMKKYKNLSLKDKAEKFNFTFVIKKSEILEYSSGPEIYLDLTGKPQISFSNFQSEYFPNGCKNSPFSLEILKNTDLFSDEILNEIRASEKMTFENILKYEEKLEVSIQVWTKLPQKWGKQKKIKGYNFANIRWGNYHYENEIFLHYVELTDSFYLISDPKSYLKSLLMCKNRDRGCFFTFQDKQQKLLHERNCTTETRIEVKQTELGLNSVLIEKAELLGILPKNLKLNDNFLFFDCESALPKTNETFGKSLVQNEHKLISIAANGHINGEHCTRVWTVRDSSEDSALDLVKNFVHFCQEQLDRVDFDPKLIESYEKLCEMGKNLRYGKSDPNWDLEEVGLLKRYISTRLELSIFGYNSQKYDLAIIFEKVCAVLDQENFDRNNLSLLKKSLAYFSVKIGRLHFKDLINFSVPMGLDRYLKIWTNHCVKMVYPYEKFSSIEEIRNCTVFPPIEDFKTGLKPDVDEKVYSDCKKMFEDRMSRSASDPEKWYTFEG